MYKEIPFSTNLLGYASLGLAILSMLCTSLALGLPYWEHYDVTFDGQQNVTNQGLWKYCITYTPQISGLAETCGDPVDRASDSGKTDIRATRALVVISLILELGCAVSIILAVFIWKRKIFVHYIAGGLGIAAGLFSMIALAVYNARVRQDGYDLHVATTMDIIAWLVSWTSAGFIIYMALVKMEDIDKLFN